mgnify:FL=1
MLLQGSCHCCVVKFTVESVTPYPFMRCYCEVCRKTQGGGGFAINLGARSKTLTVSGRRSVRTYRARGESVSGGIAKNGCSYLRRNFCGICGSALWCEDPRWPDLVHPFASAIDTKLPRTPELIHIMLGSVPNWVPLDKGKKHLYFDDYPDESIENWHRRHGLIGD